ncbi:LysR family transcriptional regulator [Neorhizobium sp. NCHU2750]|nr:LysR family transcriptional regulator [Neorhizobium sp. NCHU2750]
MNDISWDLYRSFLAVLRCGSLSAAARDLGLTQPTMGRHVEALEATLGYPLFTRSQQGLIANEAAEALRPYAETLASTVAALERHASGELGAVKGTVRITASDVIGVEVLPPILARLQHEHPGLAIELSLSDVVEDVLRREADIAVRMTGPKQDALLARHIGEIPVGLFAHQTYIERYGEPQSLADLTRHRFIGYDRQTAYIRAAGDLIRARTPDFPDFAALDMGYRTDSNIAQLAAIRAGAGIGFCQTGIARRDPDLIHILKHAFRMPLDTWVVMHEDLKLLPRQKAVFDALAKGLLDYAATT